MKNTQQTVIIVDDDKGNANLLETLLREEANYQTRIYQSGRDVLEHLDEMKQCSPVLFLMDHMLPDTDGISLCAHLHANEELKKVPTILVTGSARDATFREAKGRGITVIRKPYDINELLEVVEQLIARSSK